MDLITFIYPAIIPVAAIIGAVLSIYNTYQNWKNNKPHINIETDWKIIYDKWPNQDQIIEGYETITITNKGLKTVTLSHGYIQDYHGLLFKILEKLHLKSAVKIRKAEIFNSETGVELSSWKNYEFRIDFFYQVDPLFGSPDKREEKVKLIIAIFDQAGNEFQSKPFDY